LSIGWQDSVTSHTNGFLVCLFKADNAIEQVLLFDAGQITNSHFVIPAGGI
jgi:hypothetical protein